MNPQIATKDLIVLTADKSMKLAVEALLARSDALGIRQISCDVFQHPNNDPGVFRESHGFLRPQSRRYYYGIAMCDREGCGKEAKARERLEDDIEQRLGANGWDSRCAAVVIDPELEAWMWGDWNSVAECIRWDGDGASLKAWLIERQFLHANQAKPRRPKEALQLTLKDRIPFTSAIHQAVAGPGCVRPVHGFRLS